MNLDKENELRNLRLYAEDKHIVTVSADGTAQDLSGNQIAVFQGHQGSVWSASFSPDGQHVVTASSDQTAQVCRFESLEQLLCRGCDCLHDYLQTNPNVQSSNDLEQLALLAQNHSPLSVERQIALTKLIEGILRSGELWCPSRGQYSEDVYDEAKQNLFLYVCQNIEQYNPQRGSVMVWINMLLRRRFLREAAAKARDQRVIQVTTESNLDYLLPEQKPSLSERVRELIEEDPANIFKQEYIGDNIEANFQAIAMRRLREETWQEISSEFRIPVSTLSSFYYRCLRKFRLIMQEYLQQ